MKQHLTQRLGSLTLQLGSELRRGAVMRQEPLNLIQQLNQRHEHLKAVLEAIGDGKQGFDLVYELAVADLVTLTLILNPPAHNDDDDEEDYA